MLAIIHFNVYTPVHHKKKTNVFWLYYLNKKHEDSFTNKNLSLIWFPVLTKYIADKENGFVTFFIKHRLLDGMIKDVIDQGGHPPKNKIRKVIFKDNSGLTLTPFSIVFRINFQKTSSASTYKSRLSHLVFCFQ